MSEAVVHSTSDTCCPENVTISISWCRRTECFRVRGQWNPDQLMFFDDAVHDVEMIVGSVDEVRAGVVQVLRNFKPLLNLSAARALRT